MSASKKITLAITVVAIIASFLTLGYTTKLIPVSSELAERAGGENFQVQGNTMYPVIKDKATITVKKEPYESLNVGDIIVYNNPQYQRQVIARVVAINDDGSLTVKGDNNLMEDDVKVTRELYVGKVMAINNPWL